jgi:glucose-1-phosphate adenylyltransferase
MSKKPECIAMLLAGGQGSRLGILTKNIAKPAVPYGGKYRIIDFPLSNCVNSGIYTVGVLTQYQPLELNDYIGNGQPWDLDRMSGGVHILSPYQQIKGTEWYKGTANAIYQNINFIDRYDPEYVLILSGDHIYKMDYSKMIAFHKEKNADCTIAMLEVPWEEAPRFGLMLLNDDNSIQEFEEKSEKPQKQSRHSMGCLLYTWKKLSEYLLDDEANTEVQQRFRQGCYSRICHSAGEKMFAYPFDGYWKDVGTIDSLWEANLALLNPKVDLDLSDESWKIYSRNPVTSPHYISDTADVQNSMIAEGSEISGSVDFSVLFSNVTVEEGAVVRDSIVMPGTVIKSGAVVQYAIVAENAVIEENAVVGQRPEDMKNLDEWGVPLWEPPLPSAREQNIAPKR